MTPSDRLKVGTIVAGGAVFFGWVLLLPGSRSERPAFDPMHEARMQCLLHIKRRLHDPDSAQFPGAYEWPAMRNSDGTITVLATYRARNAFNAQRTVEHRCIATVGINSVTILPNR